MASLKAITLVRSFSTCVTLHGSNRYARITSKMGTTRFHPPRGAQAIGLKRGRGKFIIYKEMIPELVVPDLTEFPLKPYVSLRCPDNYESPVTAKDIFDTCMAPQIEADFKAGKYSKSGLGESATQSSGER